MATAQFLASLPDWRDKNQYPQGLGQFSLNQWAWEFLRRNPKYHDDYAAIGLVPDQELRERESLQVGMSYGLNGSMIDPKVAAPELEGQIFVASTPRIIGPTKYHNPIDIGAYQAAAIIDLRLPIDRQLKSIGSDLCQLQDYMINKQKDQIDKTQWQRRYKKARPEKYSAYLRVLDAWAHEQQLKSQQVAAVIFPHLINNDDPSAGINAVRTAKTAATRLRDADYRFLPWLEQYQ